ncbi:hypothetical protein BC830DRAFT_301583 [Chytriomyces sp. MP71]|nr:hypothetical protein BC830DRAFT_301583 [Chytriomyces sp. MP71]
MASPVYPGTYSFDKFIKGTATTLGNPVDGCLQELTVMKDGAGVGVFLFAANTTSSSPPTFCGPSDTASRFARYLTSPRPASVLYDTFVSQYAFLVSTSASPTEVPWTFFFNKTVASTSAPATITPPPTDSGTGGPNIGAIVAGVIVVLLVIVGAVGFAFWRKQKTVKVDPSKDLDLPPRHAPTSRNISNDPSNGNPNLWKDVSKPELSINSMEWPPKHVANHLQTGVLSQQANNPATLLPALASDSFALHDPAVSKAQRDSWNVGTTSQTSTRSADLYNEYFGTLPATRLNAPTTVPVSTYPTVTSTEDVNGMVHSGSDMESSSALSIPRSEVTEKKANSMAQQDSVLGMLLARPQPVESGEATSMVTMWTPKQVRDWATGIPGCGKLLSDALYENNIKGDLLLEITDENLRTDLGIFKLSDRLSFFAALRRLTSGGDPSSRGTASALTSPVVGRQQDIAVSRGRTITNAEGLPQYTEF